MPLDPRDDRLPDFVARVKRIAETNGLKIDPVEMAVRLVNGPFPALRISPHLFDDDTILKPIKSHIDQDTTRAAPAAKINPQHECWRGVLPDGLLAEARNLDLSSAVKRAALLATWDANGTLRSKTRSDADAVIAELGSKEASRLTAVERIRLDAARNGMVRVKQPERHLTRDELPASFRTLQGRALLDAEVATRAADKARARIAEHEAGRTFMSDAELHRAREAVTLGRGGSVAAGGR